MKKLKSVGQYFVALALAVVVSINSVVPAHAVTPEVVVGAVSLMVSAVQIGYQLYQDATTDAAREKALSDTEAIIYEYWRTASQVSFDDSIAIRVDPDELSRIAADLTLQGFPCEVVSYGYAMPSGNYKYVWVIQGAGHVYIPDIVEPDSSNGFGGRFSLRSHYFTHEGQWLYAENTSSSTILKNIYNTLHDYIGDLIYLGFSSVNEGIHLLDARLEYLTGYIAGFKDDPTAPSVMSKIDDVIAAIENLSVVGGGGDVSLDFTNINVKLDELFASLEVTIKGAADHSRIISQLSYIVSQLQYGGASPSGAWHPTTLYDYVQGIYNNMGAGGGGGGGTVSDGSLIYNAIKDFQVDFDNTFSDLQQIYPTEKVEQISSGAFEWNNGIDILNSVTASDKLATTTIYRLPQTTLNVTENNGTFRIDNDGNPLPVSVNLSYDNASHNLSTYGINETKTVTGTDIVIRDAYPTTPVSLKLYGKCEQNGVPSPTNPVPVYGFSNGIPRLHVYKGSEDAYVHYIEADFVNASTPGYGIPVSRNGNYVDGSGQKWLCDVVDFNAGTYTKNIGVITLDGSSDEYWYTANWAQNGYYCEIFDLSMGHTNLEDLVSGYTSHFPHITSYFASFTGVGFKFINSWGDHREVAFFTGGAYSSLDEFRAWLSANPVTVYYPLAEPEVYDAFEVYGNGVLDASYTRINTGDFGSSPISVTYTIGNPYTALYSDADGNWYKQRNDGSSTKITDSRVDTLNAAFNYKEYDNAADIKFNAGTNIVEVSNGELTIDYIKGSKFFNWLYLYLNNFNQPGVVGLSDVLERMDTIIELLSGSVGIGRCDHNYSSEMNQAPSCALPGLQTFTCSNCGSSYSEIIPSTGHDWRCTDHVADELDPDTGEVLTAGYDIYTCSICGDTYNDYGGTGAPDTQSDTVTGIISRVFEKLGTLAGDLIAMVIRLLDKLLIGFDELVTDFNTKTEQIVSFGGDYPMWFAGVWAIIPEDLMLALGFCVVVAILGVLGKKLVFS